MSTVEEELNLFTDCTRVIVRSVEERRREALKDIQRMQRRMRPDQRMTIQPHEPGECYDGRLYTVTVRPWP